MFHAAAWGYPFSATTQGAKLTYPGPDLTPKGIVALIEEERVTFSAGVPTVWLGIAQYLADTPRPTCHHPAVSLRRVGGTPGDDRLVLEEPGHPGRAGLGDDRDQPGRLHRPLTPEMEDWDFEQQLDLLETAGHPLPGLQVKIVDEMGRSCPRTARRSASC